MVLRSKNMKFNGLRLLSVVAIATTFVSRPVDAQSSSNGCKNEIIGFSKKDSNSNQWAPLRARVPISSNMRQIRADLSPNCVGQKKILAVLFTFNDGTTTKRFCDKTPAFMTATLGKNALDFSKAGDYTISASYYTNARTCSGPPTGSLDHTFALVELGVSPNLNIRFNKFTFPFGPPNFIPLMADDYPVKGHQAAVLKEDSTASSVMLIDDHELLPGRFDGGTLYFLKAIGGLPSMPDWNSNAFWEDFAHVVDVQIARRADIAPNQLPNAQFPMLWKDFDVSQVAEAVHDEYPGSVQADLIAWLWEQGAEVDFDILPFRSQTDFVGYEIRMADLNSWAIGTVSPTNFFLKWYAGRPRPEEVAYKIAKGEITVDDGVPQNIVTKVQSMNLKSAEEFTAYAEGSPRHPSWPAMHSAASSASFWLAVAMDLTRAQYCEALRVDYAVSYARTVAGVHYPTDNIAGLNLGQAMMAEELASHFATRYGSTQNVVQRKIDRLRFDWADFNPKTCSTRPAMNVRRRKETGDAK